MLNPVRISIKDKTLKLSCSRFPSWPSRGIVVVLLLLFLSESRQDIFRGSFNPFTPVSVADTYRFYSV